MMDKQNDCLQEILFSVQAKFQALLAVAVFMFKIEFWVKNACP